MNLKKVAELFSEEYDKADWEITEGENNIRLTSGISVSNVHDSIFVAIDIYPSLFSIEFVFEEVEVNLENLLLINEFNNESLLLKGYIEERNDTMFFVIASTVFVDFSLPRKYSQLIAAYFDEILDDDMEDYLAPIIEKFI